VVNDLVGGELLAASVYLDGERIEGHTWNSLPNGLQLGLTHEQFKRAELIGTPVARSRTAEVASPADLPLVHAGCFAFTGF
jgi:hypothetical protein